MEATLDFRGRIVVVTGGTGALGSAVVAALVEAGAVCHVPHLVDAELHHFPFRDSPEVKLHPQTDLTDEAAVQRFYDLLPGLWASIHLAGSFAGGSIIATSKSVLSAQLDANVVTCYLACRAAVSLLLKSAAGGRIVNVAARPALEWRSGAGMTAYSVSKAAVAALTVALAEEVAKDDILVNAIAPSIIDTPANRNAMPKADHAAWPKPAELAQAILFLASPENRVTRGAVVPVYGRV
jgi:NAD(P)-dependent dehydrogenase (short-subunit alcohol dehydrogenase family)